MKDQFVFTVTPDNDSPTISAIVDQTTAEDTAKNNVAFTINDIDTSLNCATSVTAASSNTTLLPLSAITLTGTAPNCTVNMDPALNENGTSTVTLTVTD